MQVAAMQVDNVYRPTEDTTGRHRQLLTALADAALQRAKDVMQHSSTAGQFCLLCLCQPCCCVEWLGLLLWVVMFQCSSELTLMHGEPGGAVVWP